MGWKTFKEHFNISHTVHVTEEGLCIGSPYINSLVVISIETGAIKKDGCVSSFLNEYYPEIKKSSPAKRLRYFRVEDIFNDVLSVFTYSKDKIIEKKAEKMGWPNVTTEGQIMYDNTFFKTKKEAIREATSDNEATLKWRQDKLIKLKSEILEVEKEIHRCDEIKKSLSNR